MVFYLSIICSFGSLLLVPIILLLNDIRWYWAIIFGIIAFVLVVGLFCIYIVITLPLWGKHYSKTYDPKDKKRWNYMVSIARFSCFWLGIRVKIEGLEKINPNRPLVFYSNHQSYIDPLIYYTVLYKIPHATMYKKVITSYLLPAGMAKALGGIPIDREDDRAAIKTVLNIISEVKKGVNFFIFVEGTRSRGIGMHHFKAGSFKIVQKSGADLVLCAIDGSYRKRLTVPFVYTPVRIKIVDVMENEKTLEYSTQELATSLEQKVKKAINEIRQKERVMRVTKKDIEKFNKQKENEDVF